MAEYTAKDFEADLKACEGISIADEKLKAGLSVTYRDERYPEKLIREYPDGRRVFIDMDGEGNEIVVGFLDS